MDGFTSLVVLFAVFSYGASNEISVKNPDMSELYRPCCFTDLQCIREEFFKRNWFVDNSNLPDDPSDNLVIPEIKIDESFFNLTIVMKDSKFKKLSDGEVKEFYINNRTNQAVLSLAFSNFTVDSKGLFVYHRVAQEPVVINTHITAFYPNMVTTTIISGLKPCAKHTFTTHGRVMDMPKYDLGKGLDEIEDPEIQCLFKKFSKGVTVAIQGSSLKLAPVFSTFFMAALTKPRPTCDNDIFEPEPTTC